VWIVEGFHLIFQLALSDVEIEVISPPTRTNLPYAFTKNLALQQQEIRI
jgi:hypothetical protein